MSKLQTVLDNLKSASLDDLCDVVSRSGIHEEDDWLIVELIRRAKEMQQHLSPKPEPEDEKMPEPVEVWLMRDDGGIWLLATEGKPTNDWDEISGPHKIIPGMMSLDELAKHGLLLDGHGAIDDMKWRVLRPKTLEVLLFDLATALKAQWAATQLAKKPKA